MTLTKEQKTLLTKKLERFQSKIDQLKASVADYGEQLRDSENERGVARWIKQYSQELTDYQKAAETLHLVDYALKTDGVDFKFASKRALSKALDIEDKQLQRSVVDVISDVAIL